MSETNNTYNAYYSGREIEVEAPTSYAAQQAAVRVFNPPKSKQHMVHVVLAARGTGESAVPVIHSTSGI